MDNLRDVYAKKAISQIPRLLGLEDRNEFSPTFGCFDRTYWLDRAIDFPTALSQFSVHSLALVYAHKFPGNIYYHKEKIKKWTIAGMDYWTQIQKNDGSFDEFYPNERGWAGPTGFTLYAVLDSHRLLGEKVPSRVTDRILNASHKAAKYLARYDEHGILANHHAIALLAIYNTYKVSDDKYLLRKFSEKLDYFFTLQSPEGWLLEYDGADLGYLSASVSFMGKLYQMYPNEKILDTIKKAIDFSSYFVYPNKFYAGTMGSRQTLHFYPHGYEIFSQDIPIAESIADKMLEGLEEGKLVPPEIMADRYVMYRVPEFLQAYLEYKPRSGERLPLPHEKGPFKKYFDDARIFVIKNPGYYALINSAKGGVIKVFNTDSQELVYNDCGVVGKLTSGKEVTSQWIDENYKVKVDDGEVEISGKLHKVPVPLPTPFKMMLFRSALLTLGRSTRAAYWLKGQIRNKMITGGSKPLPIEFIRNINFSEKIEVEDTIRLCGNEQFESLMVGDEFSVRYVPQSLYFQSQELEIKGTYFDKEMIEKLNVERKITVRRTIDPEKKTTDVKWD